MHALKPWTIPAEQPRKGCHTNPPIIMGLACQSVRVAAQVEGNDPYRLDRDGNGIGCESYL